MRSKFAKFEQNVTLCLLALPTLGVCGLENFVTPRAACVDGSMAQQRPTVSRTSRKAEVRSELFLLIWLHHTTWRILLQTHSCQLLTSLMTVPHDTQPLGVRELLKTL